MIVAVGEARDDRHALRVEGLRLLADQPFDLRAAADGEEPSAFDRKGFGRWLPRVDGVHLRVEGDEISVSRVGQRRRRLRVQRRQAKTGGAGGRQTHELAAAVAVSAHHSSPRTMMAIMPER